MAGTGQLPINMQTIGDSSFRGSLMYSSPFKETASRAMLTGVGFLAKWSYGTSQFIVIFILNEVRI